MGCTNWASLLGTPSLNLVAKQIHGHEVWLVDGLLSADECRALVDRSEAHGFGPTDFVKSYRGNLRLTTTDASLADVIWSRLKPLLPDKLRLEQPKCPGEENWWSYYPEGGGRWQASGLNECWRLAKY